MPSVKVEVTSCLELNGYILRDVGSEMYCIDFAVMNCQGGGSLSREHHRAWIWFCCGIRASQAFSRV
ncbi:hypothetical protein WI94_04235 [Burkholderia vietnamiensis]|nr:hypothetical protein WI94_04235 [Burkholderia vietnamiensis]KVE88483.1 hypothetical protein WJ00_08100 [Burkholderia vietnamiensis]